MTKEELATARGHRRPLSQPSLSQAIVSATTIPMATRGKFTLSTAAERYAEEMQTHYRAEGID
jgi:hypothetical protein